MISLSIDTSQFSRDGQGFLGDVLDRVEEATRLHAGETALEMALATPPGSRGVSGSSALERGKISVTANVLRVARPVTGAIGAESTESVVKRHWRNGKTTRRSRRIVVSRGDYEAYLQKTFPKVGYTAGGFEAAAVALGQTLPGWIADVNGPGSVEVKVSPTRVEIVFRNEVPWFGSLTGVPSRMREIMRQREQPFAEALAGAVLASARANGF